MRKLLTIVCVLLWNVQTFGQSQNSVVASDDFSFLYDKSVTDFMRFSQSRNIDSLQVVADRFLDEVVKRNITSLYLCSAKYMKAWAESAKGYTTSAFILLEEAYKVGKKVADQEKDSKAYPIYIEMLGNLAQGYYMRGSYERSLEVMNEMEQRSKEFYHEGSLQYLSSLTMKADVLNRLAHWAELISLMDKIDSVSKVVPNLNPQLLEQIQARVNQFRQRSTGQAQSAQDVTTGNNINALEQKAVLAMNNGQTQEAITVLKQILAEIEKQPVFDTQQYANYVQELTKLYSTNRDYATALDVLKQAETIVTTHDKHDPYANRALEAQHGMILYSIGDYKSSLVRLNHAKQMYDQAGDNGVFYYNKCIFSLAAVYIESGDLAYGKLYLDEFTRFIDRSIQGIEQIPELQLSRMTLSSLYAFLGYEDTSIMHLEKLLSTDKESVSSYLWNNSSFVLSALLIKRQEWGRAEQVLNNMHDELNEDMYQRRQGFLLMCSAAQKKSDVYLRQKEFSNHVQQHVKAVMTNFNHLERQIFWERQTNMLACGNYPLLHMTPDNQSVINLCYDVALYNKSMQDKVLQESKTWQEVRSSLAEGEVAVEFVAVNTNFIDDKNSRYGALLLRNGEEPQYVDLCEADIIERVFRDVIHTDTALINQLYSIDNPFLYNSIWQPMENFLKDGDIVYYTPVGSLGRINFTAVCDASCQTLSKRYHIHQVSTTANIIHMKQQRWQKPQDAVIYGGISYDASIAEMQRAAQPYEHTVQDVPLLAQRSLSSSRGAISDLEGTRLEATYIKDVLEKSGSSVRLFTDNDANEESVKALHKKAPHVLHLGTHGFMLSTTTDMERHRTLFEQINAIGDQQQSLMLQSGLLMAGAYNAWNGGTTPQGIEDGILTSYEVSQLDLGKCQLAVLSACETGLGFVNNNIGDIGLKRALKLAGVESIIVSLWEVPDDATMLLMETLYDHIANGESPLKSLEAAKDTVRRKYPQPYYWAGFCVVD